MTNLSKELCEICGIKPKIIEDYNSNEYEIYPDFEQPQNFKKLFNLNFDCSDEEYGKMEANIALYVIYNFFEAKRANKNSTNLLEGIIKAVKCKGNEAEAIKKAIREEKWKYE